MKLVYLGNCQTKKEGQWKGRECTNESSSSLPSCSPLSILELEHTSLSIPLQVLEGQMLNIILLNIYPLKLVFAELGLLSLLFLALTFSQATYKAYSSWYQWHRNGQSGSQAHVNLDLLIQMLERVMSTFQSGTHSLPSSLFWVDMIQENFFH